MAILLGPSLHITSAQAADQAGLEQRIQQLTDSMAKTQAQLEESQRELAAMRQQLNELQREMAKNGAPSMTAPTAAADPPVSENTSESSSGAIQTDAG